LGFTLNISKGANLNIPELIDREVEAEREASTTYTSPEVRTEAFFFPLQVPINTSTVRTELRRTPGGT
jgi:hypothetical protein